MERRKRHSSCSKIQIPDFIPRFRKNLHRAHTIMIILICFFKLHECKQRSTIELSVTLLQHFSYFATFYFVNKIQYCDTNDTESQGGRHPIWPTTPRYPVHDRRNHNNRAKCVSSGQYAMLKRKSSQYTQKKVLTHSLYHK